MALQFLSVGDILMLSGTAWKVGRAFTRGKKGAEAQFGEVEREAVSLSEALKHVSEALHADESLLSTASVETRTAVDTILQSAGQTLADLESLVDQYQVVKKRPTGNGYIVERTWRDVVLANYKTMKWTTEGGDITELRNLLQMHSNSINLTLQALQTRSLARLEKAVFPMAENIAALREVTGDLSEKIDDVHRIIMAVVNSTPSLSASHLSARYDLEYRSAARSSDGSITSLYDHSSLTMASAPLNLPPARYIAADASMPGQSPSGRRDSAQTTPWLRSTPHDGRAPAGTDWEFETGSPPERESGHISRRLLTGRSSSDSGSSHRATPVAIRRESATLPFSSIREGDVESRTDGPADPRGPRTSRESMHTATSLPSRPRSQQTPSHGSLLPSPALSPRSAGPSPVAATPASLLGHPAHASPGANLVRLGSRSDGAGPSSFEPSVDAIFEARTSEHDAAFERSLFRNAAILCDTRGRLVEYTSRIPDEPDPRFNTEMKAVCQACRICVVRKHESREFGAKQAYTSIWAIGDDRKVRCQQRIPETSETVPYCSSFEAEKISIPPGEGSEILLRLFAGSASDQPDREVRTTWINYVFDTKDDAAAFQTAVYGRKLLGSFRTSKTTVLHSGIKGTFALEEQFANIEMLRLWEDAGMTTPGAQGGVLALMHMSSNFGTGWARWWMNSFDQHTRVKDDGSKWARLRGINMTVVKPGAAGARVPIKRVDGIKIEFSSEEEKIRFIALVKRVQQHLIPLPPP